METHTNTYKLNQGNKEYILTTSTVGELIRITCKNSNNNVTKFSRDFSISDLKRLDPIFNNIGTADEALDYIDNALKVQKVGVTEEADTIKINFYVSKQEGVHNLELSIEDNKGGANYIQTTTTTTSKTFNMNPSFPFGANISFGKTPSFNENKDNFDQYLSKMNTETYQTTQTTQNSPYIEGVDTTNTNAEYIQTNDNTTNYLQNLQLNTDTTTQIGGTYDTTAQYITGVEDLAQQYTTGDITNQYKNDIGTDITNQFTNTIGTDITNQYTNIVDTDITNQYTNTFGTDFTNQYTNNIGTDFTNQNINTFGTDFTNQNTNPIDITGTTTTTAQYDQYSATNNTTPDYTYQFEDNFKDTTIPPYTNGGYTTQYTETTSQYTNVFDPYIAKVEKEDSNLNGYNATVQTVETKNYSDSESPKDLDSDDDQKNVNHTEKIYEHYVTKADINTNVPDERINKLVGDTNSLKSEHQLIQDKLNALSGEMNAYRTKLELMEKERANSEVNALRAENKAIKEQISQLNHLRNDAAEVRVLRTQLAQLDPLRRKAAEIDALKGQLNELHNLRAKAAELNAVKAQLGELGALRAQVGQMNYLKQQLAELNALKTKLAELGGVRSQLGELNNLRSQVNQINILKQQINELGNLKENAINAENLKKKINELEDIKYRYEQEIRNLKEGGRTETISSLRMRTYGMDSKNLLFEDKPQQVCVKGDIIHNTDELELLTRKINKTSQKLTLNLLYKATADTDKAEAFHAKCDDAKSTLVLVETDRGKRFGGFTTCSWDGDCIDKKDENAFVFSLDKMEIYENIPGEDAIGCYPKFGPIFLGCQIRIYDNAFTKGGTTFEKGLNFNTEEDYELTGGERVFNVREIEVYEVIPK